MSKAILYLFGIFYVVVGALSIFATVLVRKKFFDKCLKVFDLKKMSPVPIVAGVLLIYIAPASRFGVFITLLGILAIIKGIVTIVAPEKVERVKNWWVKADDKAYKVMGIAVLILGSVILMGIK